MFSKILIANRGEIACRVIATTRRLGIASVAVFSEADAHARHVELADEAYPIGPAPARESYLVIDNILDAARRSGAEAIHPGYGFLSENAEFADACAAAGIVFIGPPASAIRAMGSKAAAKSLMERSGVPLVPGYHGDAQDRGTLEQAAVRIGFPVLIKASAGGGGKGMRIVEQAVDFADALDGAQREARASFGDDRVLVERYLTRPRHIEIQVFADMHGNTVSLFERDCSIQRRHQKVVEEAPAPGMDGERRRAMGEAAVAAARACGYVGAGTVEFIAEGDAFYFMEMNTRLQVEHPVTEMVTGQELVEWQLRVASGEPLPATQEQLRLAGHAIEVRVYAEDPARDYLPSIGTLAHLRQPRETPDIRVDTGVRAGDAITPNYDPMIAKLIVRGTDRAAAIRRLRAALAEYEVVGVATNLGLLRAIVDHPAFAAGDLDTGFLTRHADTLPLAGAPGDAAPIWAAAAMAWRADLSASAVRQPGDPWSPWDEPDAWRMNGDGYQDLVLLSGEQIVQARLHPLADGRVRLDLPDGTVSVETAKEADGMTALRLDGVRHRLRVVRHGGTLVVIRDGRNHVVRVADPLAPPTTAASADGRLSAPIPAKVVRILVTAGETVAKGQKLVVLEAMKMELTLASPRDGVIAAVRCEEGAMVQEGSDLVSFEATP